ncbi:MAG: LysR family transcriptional regulator, partial [Oleibacter sp.]|nr:LysR family transcriptional regulator [Thalassolituus sp.]
MSKTTLEQWRMFAAVVKYGGFNQAATQVHKSQSSIHHAVTKLEEELGLELFQINGRKTELTDAGKLMLRRGQSLLDEVGRIEAVAHSISLGTESEFRIAVDGAFPQHIIFQALDAVSKLFPYVRIDIFDTVLSGTNELIAQNKVDIGLSPRPMPQGLNEELCLLEFIAVARHDHPLNTLDRELTYDDLKTCRQIIVRDSGLLTQIDTGWHGAEQRWTVGHLRESIELINKGVGFAWLPMPSILESLNNGTLRPLALKEG